MNNAFWVLIFAGVFLIGTIVLQVYLSKKDSKIPGLILPVITFVIAVFVTIEVILAGTMYHVEETTVEKIITENEEAVGGGGIAGTDSNDDTTFIMEDGNYSSTGDGLINEDSNTADSIYLPEEKVVESSTVKTQGWIGLTTFLLYNIPTVLYGGIYISCRKKKKGEDGGKNSDVDKMKIQDL